MLCSWKRTWRRIKELLADLLLCSLPSKQRPILSRKRRRIMNNFHDWGIGGNLTLIAFNICVSMQVCIKALVVFNLYFLFCLTALLATSLLTFLISTHMLCFVESKTEHVSVHVSVLFLGDFMAVCWTKKTKSFGLDLSWTKTKSIRLDFHVQKLSPMNLISMYRNRVQWTRFPGLCGHLVQLSSPKSSPLDSNC